MKSVVIVGCPYSGTRFISKILTHCYGFEIGHESLSAQGIVSWRHTHWTREKFFEAGVSEDCVFYQQVKHPIMAISSFVVLPDVVWEWIADYAEEGGVPWRPDNPHMVIRSMGLWYWWNTMAERISDYTYSIEELPYRWRWFLGNMNAPYRELPLVGPAMNRHEQRPILSWNTMYDLDPELTDNILEMSRRYGYVQVPISYMRDPFYAIPSNMVLQRGE